MWVTSCRYRHWISSNVDMISTYHFVLSCQFFWLLLNSVSYNPLLLKGWAHTLMRCHSLVVFAPILQTSIYFCRLGGGTTMASHYANFYTERQQSCFLTKNVFLWLCTLVLLVLQRLWTVLSSSFHAATSCNLLNFHLKPLSFGSQWALSCRTPSEILLDLYLRGREG